MLYFDSTSTVSSSRKAILSIVTLVELPSSLKPLPVISCGLPYLESTEMKNEWASPKFFRSSSVHCTTENWGKLEIVWRAWMNLPALGSARSARSDIDRCCTLHTDVQTDGRTDSTLCGVSSESLNNEFPVPKDITLDRQTAYDLNRLPKQRKRKFSNKQKQPETPNLEGKIIHKNHETNHYVLKLLVWWFIENDIWMPQNCEQSAVSNCMKEANLCYCNTLDTIHGLPK